MPLGCEVAGYYTMESDSGPVAGSLTIDDEGNFAIKFPITVSKTGKDKEGTTYKGSLSAKDGKGNKVIQEFFVKVRHDRGKK